MSQKRVTTAVMKSGAYYTYTVSVSFKMQFTFHESEVQPATEGFKHDREPSDKSLNKLKKELEKYITNNYAISDLDVAADFESLLGKTAISLEKRPVKLKRKVTPK
jgi:hypothetical protein